MASQTLAEALRAGAASRADIEALASAPLRLHPDNLVERPWGGRALIDYKGLDGAAHPQRYGECFELAADPRDREAAEHPSQVQLADGSSLDLPSVLAAAGEAVLGPALFAEFGPRLPLLPKTLDVAGLLSVQAHPPGNPEVYVVLAREPGATLRLGFCEAVDRELLTRELEAGRRQQEALLELLREDIDQHQLQAILAEHLGGGAEDVEACVDALGPQLRRHGDRMLLAQTLAELFELVHAVLGRLNAIAVEPGQVIFNADPPAAHSARTPSAQVHALGNLEGRSMLLLEIRRPGPTFRAWDHLRFPMREIAVERALAAMSCAASRPEDFLVEPAPVEGRPGVFRSVACPAFIVDHLRPRGERVVALAPGAATSLHCVSGDAGLRGPADEDWGRLRAGESALIPAGVRELGVVALDGEVELIQVSLPVGDAREQLEPAGSTEAGESPSSSSLPSSAVGKRRNLAELRRVVRESEGPSEVLAIVNGGDGPTVDRRLRTLAPAIFRADGQSRIFTHEEHTRRGQLLGLLDAHRALRASRGGRGLDRDRVALGIMLPGKGTRLSPLTQRLHGIKPFLPVPVRADGPAGPVWLDAATASLWTWTLVARSLERAGFRGVAWKWGDEPQIPARALADFDRDLSGVDAVRFGAEAVITEDLARNKEWLHVDRQSGELLAQIRRRPRAELLRRLGVADDPGAEHRAHVHIGSPAFSHLFLGLADELFADLPGWLDVDGYLFEALTHDEDEWAAERARDPGIDAVLAGCPDFYARVRELRRRVEAERGHPLRVQVIDFGAELYWGDVGQLAKAREVFAALGDAGEEGDFARRLAQLDELEPDRFGNRVLGDSTIPQDGSVRDSVIIDGQIDAGRIEGAVVIRSKLGLAGLEPGSVAIDCSARALRLEPRSLAFASIVEDLRVPADHVHTSLPADPQADPPSLQSWFADARVDVGAAENYEQPRWGNPSSFAEKFAELRQRAVDPSTVDARIEALRRELMTTRPARRT